jgi:hypothetical protein
MELSHEFEVGVPIEQAWAVLTDLERIAPCLPGARLTEVEGPVHRGVVKVKVGPITAQYQGEAHLVEQDEAAHRAVLTASGRDTRGQGTASAAITAQLTAEGDRTHVSLLTDLTVTGKVAQFGRGVLGDVSNKLLAQFVENLEATVLGPDAAGGEESSHPALEEPGITEIVDEFTVVGENEAGELVVEHVTVVDEVVDGRVVAEAVVIEEEVVAPGAGGVRRIDAPEAEPIDLLDAAGGSVAARLAPLLGLAAAVVVVGALARRRRRRR